MVTTSDLGLRGGIAQYTPCERFRRSRGMSQVRLAGLAGVSITTLGAIEDGRVARLRLETLFRVAQVLGVSCVDLVPGLSVRSSEGGRAQESGGAKRASGKARREYVRRTLVEKLAANGGRMRGCDAVAQVMERCRVTANCVLSVRRESGIAAVRVAGRGLDAWEWRLGSEPAGEPGAPG